MIQKKVILPNNWLTDNAPVHFKFSVNYGPQILGKFPILLGVNLNELQKFPKVNLSSKYRDIFYWIYSGEYTRGQYDVQKSQ